MVGHAPSGGSEQSEQRYIVESGFGAFDPLAQSFKDQG